MPGGGDGVVRPPRLPYAGTRAGAARLPPGATLRRLVLRRYLPVYREPGR